MLVIVVITGGVALFRAKEGIFFESLGFVLVIAASASGGLRWVLTQVRVGHAFLRGFALVCI